MTRLLQGIFLYYQVLVLYDYCLCFCSVMVHHVITHRGEAQTPDIFNEKIYHIEVGGSVHDPCVITLHTSVCLSQSFIAGKCLDLRINSVLSFDGTLMDHYDFPPICTF